MSTALDGVDEDEGTSAVFTRARQTGGLALFSLAIAVMLIDAIRTDYSVDTIQLGLILGTGAVLLGVDAVRGLLK